MAQPRALNWMWCIHEKHNFSRATRSWFTDKMKSSSINLQPSDWCCDACNVELNWMALSQGGWWARLELHPSATGVGSGLGVHLWQLPCPSCVSFCGCFIFSSAHFELLQCLFLSASGHNYNEQPHLLAQLVYLLIRRVIFCRWLWDYLPSLLSYPQ